MIPACLAVVALAAGPALHTISNSAGRCVITARTPPGWQPVELAGWDQPCVTDGVIWSPDGSRVVSPGKQAELLDAKTKTRVSLPSLPDGRVELAFGVQGEIYAFTSVWKVDAVLARAWLLEGDHWKLLESAKTPTDDFGVSTLFKVDAKRARRKDSLGPAREPAKEDLARLAKIAVPEGFSWKVAVSSNHRVAWQVTGTDACAAFAPIVVLPPGKAIVVPFEKWPADTCRNLFAQAEWLLIDNAVSGPNQRALLVDLRDGSTVVSLPPGELRAALVTRPD
jgi:hypothetical protein